MNRKRVLQTVLIIGVLLVALVLGASRLGLIPGRQASLAGRYVGYSWKGEAQGVRLADASEYIETILELDAAGVIRDVRVRFFVKKDGFWVIRQSGSAYVAVDFSVTPTAAVPGDNYSPGRSMFTIDTADMMSFYAVAVNSAGTAAVALVDPITRYQFELRVPSGFDYTTRLEEFTIGSGRLVPAVRTSTGGLIKPADWASLADKHMLNISPWSHVITDKGVLRGITAQSSIRAFLEALGVVFVDGRPQPKPVQYGYYGIGGWQGNYDAIAAFLVGKNAKSYTSLINWSLPRYAGGINEKN